MVTRLNAYLTFNGNAREAMEFYADVFGGELVLNTFAEYGAPEAPGADRIMHAMLETTDGMVLMGADVPLGEDYVPGGTISMSLSGEDADALHGFWKRLSDTGSVTVPLEKQMWGDEFGMCTDQFGIDWMVNIGQPQD